MKKLPLLVVLSLLLGLLGASAANAGQTGLSNSKVTMLLELQHPGGLNRFVRRVSDPSDPLYRDYSTVEQLVARYGAPAKTSKRVVLWLAKRGVQATLSPTHTFVTAELLAKRAAAILPPAKGAASASSAGAGLRPRAVPAALRGLATRVAVGTDLPVHTDDAIGPAPAAEAEGGTKSSGKYGSVLFHTGTAAGCAAGSSGAPHPIEPFTPNQYLTAYGDASMHSRGLTGEGQSVAVVEQGGFKRSDIEMYDKCFGVKKTPPTSVEVVLGAKRPAAEDETTLDLEQLSVGAPGLDHIYVYEAPESTRAIVLAAGNALGNPRHRPNVISISLGICEPQIDGALAWRDALDNIFAVAAGSGISVLVSSGDQGSSGCRAENTETEETTALPLQAVSLPSSSPYVTAVGGTNLSLTKSNHIHDEIVWNDSWINGKPGIPWSGAGGVSIISPRTPWWQMGVHGYGPGRKVPDISALADRFPGYAFFCTAAACKGEEEKVPGWSVVGGTSAATPLTAAGIALINQSAEESGQPDLGFLNPLIYRTGYDATTRKSAFFDVTSGNDDIWPALSKLVVGMPYSCCGARPGYDWASGWGSLKIPAFGKLALAAYKPVPVPVPVAKSAGSAGSSGGDGGR
jgi:subtilase family serine protease